MLEEEGDLPQHEYVEFQSLQPAIVLHQCRQTLMEPAHGGI